VRSSLRPNPSEVVKVTVPAARSRRPIGATGVSTAPPAGVAYASAAVKSPAMIASSLSDHTRRRPYPNGRPRAVSVPEGDPGGGGGAVLAPFAGHERDAHADLQRVVAVQRAQARPAEPQLERDRGSLAQLARGALEVLARCAHAARGAHAHGARERALGGLAARRRDATGRTRRAATC